MAKKCMNKSPEDTLLGKLIVLFGWFEKKVSLGAVRGSKTRRQNYCQKSTGIISLFKHIDLKKN
jgi:hypothetical protein